MMGNQQIITQEMIAKKPSIVQRRSSGSVRVAFLNREAAIAELTELARSLLEQDDRVIAVGLFGSLAHGQALPSSDADVLIVLREHPQQRWMDRIPEYAAAFQGSALPVEPFPYTVEELLRMSAQPGFVQTALCDSIFLGGDKNEFVTIREAVSSRSG